MRMASISQHTSTITCTDALRVWHFSAFYFFSGCSTAFDVQTALIYSNAKGNDF